MSRGLAQPIGGDPNRPPHAASVAVVALGSNLGDRAQTIDEAVRDIARLPLVDAISVSTPIESVAVTLEGPDADAPPYLNAVALVTTRLAPTVLLTLLHRIEAAHGRERRAPAGGQEPRWGDRTLDLDLIAYGNVIVDTPALTLPHPRAAERDFVLEPWLAVDPDAVLPGSGRVADLLAAVREGGRE
ncbi:MAG TPA: 2-amino-4-hydroxy-6-hydroxymethyldihydropteridine diphosphokinase [Microbacterium sp.]|uniref:2-amino-4-hydroxy-6- hydroxymethyldihydropteridine diphosphokinase n=1 Tax=Microbacterium sp. TaxID=51671 RepID=UPI002BE2246B|nr:2-amino-4-hydroxy-6-hydroxymethyldihydropteridine diphosphokinase [Microbacterium sp.]HWI31103.1 2-amino-4-hydroxy-6-hydroxymethyldihydropteridine diphosphokinase [Microbacterium sp.]